jgi:hypothetical protein
MVNLTQEKLITHHHNLYQALEGVLEADATAENVV